MSRAPSKIDRDKQIELAFFGSNFGNVDMEEADRILFESLLGSLEPALPCRLDLSDWNSGRSGT